MRGHIAQKDLYHKTLISKLSVGSIEKAHILILDALNRSVTWEIIVQNVASSKLYNDSCLVIQTSVGTPFGPRNLMRHYYRILDTIVKEHPDFPRIRLD